MISVYVKGPAGIGKSLLVCVLRWQLKTLGLNVEVRHETSAASVAGCADLLRASGVPIVIYDSEDKYPDD